ncbi:MAG: hypothetical protein HY688_02225 [Chloroflexi bacterium]|nr:hypothetical protein [Chloroflexota bacterium]
MANIIWATGFLAVIVGSILALLLGVYLEHRQTLARIQAGLQPDRDPLSGRRRALGWGLGVLFAGVALIAASFFFALPGATSGQGQGAGLVVGAVGLALIAYTYLAPRLRS